MMPLVSIIALAGLISVLAFSWAYIITRQLEQRRSHPHTCRVAAAFEQRCVACQSRQLTPVQLTVPDGGSALLAVSQRGDGVESVGALRCETCGHIMLYSEPIMSFLDRPYSRSAVPFQMPPRPTRNHYRTVIDSAFSNRSFSIGTFLNPFRLTQNPLYSVTTGSKYEGHFVLRLALTISIWV